MAFVAITFAGILSRGVKVAPFIVDTIFGTAFVPLLRFNRFRLGKLTTFDKVALSATVGQVVGGAILGTKLLQHFYGIAKKKFTFMLFKALAILAFKTLGKIVIGVFVLRSLFNFISDNPISVRITKSTNTLSILEVKTKSSEKIVKSIISTLETLRNASPIRKGNYVSGFAIFVNGNQVPILAIRSGIISFDKGDVIEITNISVNESSMTSYSLWIERNKKAKISFRALSRNVNQRSQKFMSVSYVEKSFPNRSFSYRKYKTGKYKFPVIRMVVK